MGEFNAEKYYEEYRTLPHGEMSMAYLREAWKEADEVGDYKWRIKLRSEFIHECDFYSDAMEMYVVMPELLRIYDEYAEQYGADENLCYDILWKYKWVVDTAQDFYQVSIPQFESISEDMKRRFLEAGYSLRPYYIYQYEFYKYIDREKAEHFYQEFTKCKRDNMSDCQACERNREVDYFLESGNLEMAEKRAKVLFERMLTCKVIPEGTYGHFLRYYNLKLCKGEEDCLEKAEEYCENVKQTIRQSGLILGYIGDVLLFYSLTNQQKALHWFKHYWQFYESNKNPMHKFYFALGMIRFIKRLQEKKSSYRMKLPNNFPLYQESGNYDLAHLREHYESYAISCAQKMDGRNGTAYFMDIYKTVAG